MLVHTVFFWLRPDLTEAERAEFRTGVESLKAIEAATAVYVGTPAATGERPVIDASYDFCLTVLLPDVPAHDIYQDHPVHLAFIAANKPKWTRVLVYDAD